ncbi:hypothetical protein WMY93_010884 [Mugilogobius chulae]|uniref:Uncharacterized protein n=1 Tax=Mugilogobius chulae TaxID=88201 RepID=A0AAW0P9T5_9GOBI
MDGIDTLQSSSLETKAERIARYKEERRKELAKLYGNTEDFTSRYVRRDKKAAEHQKLKESQVAMTTLQNKLTAGERIKLQSSWQEMMTRRVIMWRRKQKLCLPQQ